MMEDFSGLALPPLFGGHILEAELEPGGVELGPGEVVLDPDPGGSELLESTPQEDEERRALDKRKCLVLSRRCKEIEQVNQKILGRLHQVQRITRRLKKERRFLMKALDAHGDDYRKTPLTILLEEEPGAHLDSAAGVEEEKLNGLSGSSATLHHAAGPKKKRHRISRQDKDKDQQIEPDVSVLAETHFGEMPSPTSLSH
ncbi:TCF3 fusion partner [Xiphophorus maculatus]|uniref:TCF3 (E2A) fusion partner n=2 Tax=Xiphophorus TaxID=8082 RepID=A0A3B5R4Z8_XIPMA|nr:TCF3 fusion partner [Xiphophorus maculatus]XP_027867962.1 TCF3 fusion partner [Xiphophorus couchianus]XP_032414706.1 TCF3 fusion partner [Xiphophorus hellerii]